MNNEYLLFVINDMNDGIFHIIITGDQSPRQ